MKYGGGLPRADSSCIPRCSSSCRATKPAGFCAPLFDSGSIRITAGGLAGCPGLPGPDDAPAGAACWLAQDTLAVTSTRRTRGRNAARTGKGDTRPIA